MLKDAPDQELEGFLGLYSLATVAELLIKSMPDEARKSFFITMRTTYPNDFEEKKAP